MADALDSVLEQSHPAVEIIVVNDGSTDETAALARQYEGRVKYVYQENRGVSAARNAGLQQRSGTYVQFLDADDKLERDKLAVHVDYLEQHPQTGIVYGDARYFTTENPSLRNYAPDPRINRPWIRDLWEAPGSMLRKLAYRNLMPVHCSLLRSEVVDMVGPWNEGLPGNEDWEYWIRCAAAHVGFHFENRPGTFVLRMHEASATKNQTKMDAGRFLMRVSVARRNR